MGERFKREGIYVYLWSIHIFVQQKPTQHWKTIVIQLRINLKKTTSCKVRASLVAQRVKNLSAMWEKQVQTLGWEDPLEKGVATHSSILA